MRTNALAAILALVLVPMLASCRDAPKPHTPPANEIPAAGAQGDTRVNATIDSSPDTPGPAAPDLAAREDSLRSALRSLLAGPSAEQREAGAASWFSDTTANALREVEVDGGPVVVDLDGDLPRLIPGASSSAGSEMLLAHLDSVVFGLPWVEAVEYRMAGSCAAFWEWLQRECAVVTR